MIRFNNECKTCDGTGKVPHEGSLVGGTVVCDDCDGLGRIK